MGFSMNRPNMSISYGGESNKKQKSNLMKDNPVAKHASAMNMGKDHSPVSKKSPMHQAKPDYIDIDGDGDTSEPMKAAAKEKKSPLKNTKNKLTKEQQAYLDRSNKKMKERAAKGKKPFGDRKNAKAEAYGGDGASPVKKYKK
tara:strand:+ start:90 stop:518 length:429 start_codon:yes stop_codon:yes gene_type:complete